MRHEMLQRIERCVCGDRDHQYGPPEDSFADIAAIANVALKTYLARPLDDVAVALFMRSLKLARNGRDPLHLDSWIDGGGYSVCGGAIVLGRQGDV